MSGQSLPILVVALAGLAAGCSTPLSQLKTELGARAATELGCDERKLEYKELERVISTTRVAVSGCGKSLKYKMVESRWSIDTSRTEPPKLELKP